MLSLKKVYSDELLQIALLLSLLRVNQNSLNEDDIYGGVSDLDFRNGTSWRSINPVVLRTHYIHPKSLDSVLLNYERELFADLNSLGRFNHATFRHSDVTAYLLNIERSTVPVNDQEPLSTSAQNRDEDRISDGESTSNPLPDDLELTQEDMDLIEVLWKQDVDLGFTLEAASQTAQKDDIPGKKSEFGKDGDDLPTSLPEDEDTLDKLKSPEPEEKIKEEDAEPVEEDIWAGVDYTVDTETGEYVIKGENGADSSSSCDLEDLSLPLPEFLLDEALRLVDIDDESPEQSNAANLDLLPLLSDEADEAIANADSEDTDDLYTFPDMIQTPQFHHPHHRAAFQSRMPFMRTMSMEQRWQDLANLLSLPSPGDGAGGLHHPFGPHHALHNYSHQHAHAAAAAAAAYGPDARGVLLHNATLTPPMGDLNATVPYGNLGGTIGNAVATSMNLTNSSEPMGEPSTAPHYKLEPSNEMMYYPNNTTSEFGSNQTDGFLSSILNDEDLQLMDMAMNEGMYTMRMLESNNTVGGLNMNNTPATTTVSRTDMERLDTSSDSAVSSMGSERVPSLSDGEWCDAGSDSGHTTNGEHYMPDYQNKYRPYDYSYSNRQLAETTRMPPVAQKKHQMYGKRYFQDQGSTSAVPHPHTPVKYEYRDTSTTSYNSSSHTEGSTRSKVSEMKYSCSLEFNHMARSPADHIQHNHTYHLPAENSGAMQRPVSRDKPKSRKSDEEHLTRDEKRARTLSIPISVEDIINLPMDEFNERLSKYDLSEAQLSLIRDIRRRGKNKVAAQNCRKRKLDQILSLADEVKEMKDRKMRLLNDHEFATNEVKRMKDKYQQLYRHVFQNLRDPDGNQYSPYQYSLQTTADGSILMVPRSNSTVSNPSEHKEPPQNQND